MKPIEKLNEEYFQVFESQIFNTDDLDYSRLDEHIAFLTRLDVIENSSISVFDLYRKEHVYISGKFATMLGYNQEEIKMKGNDYFDRKIHPDDFYFLMKNGIELLKLAFSVPVAERRDYKLISDYRVMNAKNCYTRVIEQHQTLELDKAGNIWLALSLLDYSPDQDIASGIKSRIYNYKKGEFIPMPGAEIHDETDMKLSRREREILKLVQEGMPSKEIAEKLYISIHTVNTHRQRILEKLEVSNSHEAIQYATSLGILN
jgi:DNA-binding CsgD family transcriptional regulator